MSNLAVILRNLIMDGTPDADGDSFRVWDVDGLDGAPVDSSVSDRNGNGGHVDRARLKPREMLIHGNAWAPTTSSEASIWRVRQKIEAALAPMLDIAATVYFDMPLPGVPVQLDCRSLGQLHFLTPTATVQGFEVPLTAPDPLKYTQVQGSANVNSTTATLTNSGNYPTFPVATLQQDTNVASIHSGTTGQSLVVNTGLLPGGILPAGSTIDFKARQLDVAGVGIFDAITFPRDWIELAPGDNSITTVGNWRFTWRSAYR